MPPIPSLPPFRHLPEIARPETPECDFHSENYALLSGNGGEGGGPVSVSKGAEAAAAASGVLGAGDGGGGGSVSEEFANRRRYDISGEDERAVIRSTMNAAKTKTSHIITSKKLPEQEQRLGPDGQLKLYGFVDKLKQYARQRNSSSRKKESQVSSALEEIKQRIKGPLAAAYEDDYGGGGGEEAEWAAFDEPTDDGRVEVVNLVFAPEAVEDGGDGTAIKIFPDSELEKLKVTVADRALLVNFLNLNTFQLVVHFTL